MKKSVKKVLSVTLLLGLTLAPVNGVAYAHGCCHGGGYSENYYYCGGHSSHTHYNGSCPYVSTSSSYTSKATVRCVQYALNDLGYNCGTVNGVYGSKTKTALKQFQKDNGIKANGKIGPITCSSLGVTVK